MADPQLLASVPEGMGDVGGAVISHDALDTHAALAEVLDGGSEEGTGGSTALILSDTGHSHAGGIIDRHVHEVPADTAVTQPSSCRGCDVRYP